MKILLVEDNKDQSETLAKLLLKAADHKATVICASTLRDGLAKAKEECPDAILTDLLLPDVNSYKETLACLPDGDAPERFPQPVIVTTGLEDPDGQIFIECMRAGADNVFYKPFCLRATRNLVSILTAASIREKVRANKNVER